MTSTRFEKILSQKVLILGSTGQLGRALKKALPKAVALTRKEADFSKPSTLESVLDETKPEIIFIASAYTAVDLAEKEEALAHTINATSVEVIAKWCAQNQCVLVHYSTDYVFPGNGVTPWKESDPVSPINAYGRSKLAGEQLLLKTFYKHGLEKSRYFIFRTSWVYDSEGKNFVLTMLRLGNEKETLGVVGDQIGAPTFAQDLAFQSLRAVEKALGQESFPSGVYHFCQAGETSWHGFAEAIFQEARAHEIPFKVKEIQRIPSETFPTPAKRPRNSRLSTLKAEETLGIVFRDWKLALKECMDQISKKRMI